MSEDLILPGEDEPVFTRPSNPGADALLGRVHPALDHGFVRLVDYMGGDDAIVQAARTSYGRGTRTPSSDTGLINTLMRDWHTSVFEMTEFKFHIKMPIFVARQWIRHRMANLNEYSGRYSVMDREFYIPLPDVLARQSISNKQGREGPLSPEESGRVLELLKRDAEQAFDDYDEMIDEDGIRLSRELARINLPLSTYTQMYWKIDLHNLLNFLRLRMDSHAQYEIRVYAEIIGAMVAKSCPLAWDAFREYRLEAMQLSAKEVTVLGDLLAGRMPLMEAFTSARERRAFEAKLARLRQTA